MEGDKQKKTKCKSGSRRDKGETVEETYSEEENSENNGDAGEAEASSVRELACGLSTTRFVLSGRLLKVK